MTIPIVVAGGGLAGATAACVLARAGRNALVLERDAVPSDKICGEFISIEAQHYLRDLGIDLTRLGAEPIERVRLIRDRSTAEAALPFRGLSLSRLKLDAVVLAHAVARGAEVRRGCMVASIGGTGPVALTIAGAGELQAKTVFLATGKRDLRGAARRPPTPPEDLIGFKLHYRLAAKQRRLLSGYVEVMIWPDGYAGLQPLEDGQANLCMLASSRRLRRVGRDWGVLLEDMCRSQPHLAARLDGATAMSLRPVSISRVPYGFVHSPNCADIPNLFRLGDQVGVIPSFTGDGMAIALHSATLAAASYLAGESNDTYHRRIRHDIARPVGLATALFRLCKYPAGQTLLLALASAWPGSLQIIASATRLPSRALPSHSAAAARAA